MSITTRVLRENEPGSRKCHCGAVKRLENLFCEGCYARLPQDIADRLNHARPVCMAKAYSIAVQFLQDPLAFARRGRIHWGQCGKKAIGHQSGPRGKYKPRESPVKTGSNTVISGSPL